MTLRNINTDATDETRGDRLPGERVLDALEAGLVAAWIIVGLVRLGYDFRVQDETSARVGDE